MTHQMDAPPSRVDAEPVTAAEAARVLIAVAVAAGWLTAQQANLVTVGLSAVGVLASIILTWWARRKTTSLARPRDDEGTPLIPSAPPTKLAN